MQARSFLDLKMFFREPLRYTLLTFLTCSQFKFNHIEKEIIKIKKISLIFVATLVIYLNFFEIGVTQEIAEWHSVSYYRASFSYPNTFGGGIFCGDFDNNNYLDILTKHFQSDGKITLFMNDGQGSFRISTTINSAPYPVGATLADFNNDNNLDFAFANSSFLNRCFLIQIRCQAILIM